MTFQKVRLQNLSRKLDFQKFNPKIFDSVPNLLTSQETMRKAELDCKTEIKPKKPLLSAK